MGRGWLDPKARDRLAITEYERGWWCFFNLAWFAASLRDAFRTDIAQACTSAAVRCA